MPRTLKCPICKRSIPEGPSAAAFHPFCSKRCADADLGRWLTGSYAIPAVEVDDESESEAGGGPDEAGEPWPPGRGGRPPVRH